MNAMETLNGIFQTVFDDDSLRISAEMTANDIDGWDSLSHVNLITAVEMKFRIRFNQKELLTLRNVGDLARSIEEKLET